MVNSKFIFSAGFLSQKFQRSVYDINEAVRELGIEPSITINDVQHFDGVIFFKLREFFREQERQKQSESVR
jgi:hypothetical protein